MFSFILQNLHGFFPQLLSNIFGYSGNTDWGLKTLSRDSKEYANVHKFLSPGGTVFKLIDLLQADDQHRYEFFISCLPVSVAYQINIIEVSWYLSPKATLKLTSYLRKNCDFGEG